jgi:outer membrane protein assembly factor BamE (lipoprotein component of BamABCDE complex)
MRGIAYGMAVVAFVSLLGGCMLIRGTVGEPFAPEAVQFIQHGRTTKQEVVGKLGTPSVIAGLGPDRERYVYHFNQMEGSGFLGYTVQDYAQFLEVIFRGNVVESHQHVVPVAGR